MHIISPPLYLPAPPSPALGKHLHVKRKCGARKNADGGRDAGVPRVGAARVCARCACVCVCARVRGGAAWVPGGAGTAGGCTDV